MSYDNAIHLLADYLADYFESSGAVNYIEQTFKCKHDSSKLFLVTMQKVDGLTPCEKLAKAEKLNADMYEMLELAMSLMDGDSIEDFTCQYKEIESLIKRARGE